MSAPSHLKSCARAASILSVLSITSITGCTVEWESKPGDYWDTANRAPTISISSPDNGSTIDEGSVVVLAGVVSDDKTNLDELLITVSSSSDGELANFVPQSSGDFSVELEGLERGVYNLNLTVVDEGGLQANAEVSFSMGTNTPPTNPFVEISTSSPKANSELVAELIGESTDVDGDLITYIWSWSVDGSVMEEFTESTLPEDVVSKDQVWEVSVYATDGIAESDISTDSVTIGDSNPVVTVEITPESPKIDDSLTCTWSAVDPDGDTIDEEESWWEVNGENIGDATTPLSGVFASGDEVMCVVTVDAGDGFTIAQDVVVIDGEPPTTGKPTITGGPVDVTGTLTCVGAGSDPDGDTLSYDYDWLVNGFNVGLFTQTINGANFSKGDSVVCRATAVAVDGEGDPMDSDPETIINAKPGQSSNIYLTPDPVTAGEPLTCNVAFDATDADNETISYYYFWFDGSSQIMSLSRSTSPDFDTTGYEGSDIKCASRAEDPDGAYSPAIYSQAQTVLAGGPSTYTASDADLVISSSNTGGYFGRVVSEMGDLDGDSASELVITEYGTGMIYAYLSSTLSGATSNLTTSDADFSWAADASDVNLGAANGLSYGDADNDGSNDFIITSQVSKPTGLNNQGVAYIMMSGDMTSWVNPVISSAAQVTVYGDTGDKVGYDTAMVDLSGDGYAEVIIGAPFYGNGAAGVFSGADLAGQNGASLAFSDAAWFVTGSTSNSRLGESGLTALSDLDGDGTRDFAVGAMGAQDSSGTATGVTYIISGADLADDEAANIAWLTIEGGASSDAFGAAVTSPGDLDGDGADDLFISATSADVGGVASNSGAVYMFLGGLSSGTISVADADASWGDDDANANIGYSLASPGDINGDGIYDVLVSGHLATPGEAYLLSGGDYSAWQTNSIISDDMWAGFVGSSNTDKAGLTSTTLDFDSDGQDDWVVGVSGAQSVYLFSNP